MLKEIKQGTNLFSQIRFCKQCMERIEHEIVNSEQVEYNPRGRAIFRCKRCGKVSSMRNLRPSSEVSY